MNQLDVCLTDVLYSLIFFALSTILPIFPFLLPAHLDMEIL